MKIFSKTGKGGAVLKSVNKIVMHLRQIPFTDYLLYFAWFFAAVNVFVAFARSKVILLLFISIVLLLVFVLKLFDKRDGMRGKLPAVLSVSAYVFLTILFLNPVLPWYCIAVLMLSESVLLLVFCLIVKRRT